jgi:hypothetical protein
MILVLKLRQHLRAGKLRQQISSSCIAQTGGPLSEVGGPVCLCIGIMKTIQSESQGGLWWLLGAAAVYFTMFAS